ncbi:MAG: hypothetical protein O3B31_08710 [Chloroflexi bacterium]|nr:hypothetical protein [Chloroflexota bacterium]MDA1003407.1 hypothetical protein [Chloroflexota bacterium]MQC27812.1 hypothetical protein [Chloroflexota bacterium]
MATTRPTKSTAAAKPATATRKPAARKAAPAATRGAKKLVFPSVEWFAGLAALAKADEAYRKFGRLNATVVFVAGASAIEVTFDVLDIHSIRKVNENHMRDADFVVELAPELWTAMLDDIKKHGHATQEWTLNTLDLRLDEPIHANLLDDGFKADMFFRYNPSLQRFFDNAAQLDFTVKVAATA